MDYNITGRASFVNDTSIVTKYLCHPGQEHNCSLHLEKYQMMAVKKITVSCIAGYSNGVPYPPDALPIINIPNIIDMSCGINTTKSLNPYGFVSYEDCKVIIGSDQFFELNITLHGTLFTCKQGMGNLSYKEAIGFAMQDATRQGRMVLDEGAFDNLNNFIISNGGPNFRSFPFSMESIKQLPDVLQNIVVQKLILENSHLALEKETTKALPVKDDILASFLKDAFESNPEFDPNKLKKLAQHMLSRGWAK